MRNISSILSQEIEHERIYQVELKGSSSRSCENLKTATVSRSCKGNYYISILVEDGKELPVKQTFSESTTVGIDVGIKDFAVLSIGEKIENPKYLKNSLKRLKALQKRVSRKQKGSKSRAKAKQRLAVLRDKIINRGTTSRTNSLLN
jgi:putative transposase